MKNMPKHEALLINRNQCERLLHAHKLPYFLCLCLAASNVSASPKCRGRVEV